MSILEDVRFGFRTLVKSPGFTAIAVTALALGIGVNACVFSLVNAVLFKNLPFANSDKILYIVSTKASSSRWWPTFSYPDFLELQSQMKSFDAIGASTGVSANISDHTASPEGYNGARITVNTFSVIGQKPVAGRDFVPADGEPGAPPVAIISYKVWENRYGKDMSVIGRTVRIDEEPTTIIGVMPPRLDFPRETLVWKPLIATEDYKKRENRRFTVFGHIAPHADIKSASTEANGIMQRIAAAYPITNKEIGARVIDFNEVFAAGEIKTIFLAMLGAVSFVLLIACANVANLQLARAVGRMREVSIRVALGAGRWRIIRQLLIESLMVSIAGGLIGWMMGLWGIRAFDAAVTQTGKPQALDFTMDTRALLYLAAITIGTGILFGLAPALRLSKLDVNTSLKDGGRGSSGGGRGKYLSGLLVVFEMALAVVLLAGAGLMIRSFMNAYRDDLGIHTTNIVTMRIDLPKANYKAAEQQLAFYDRLKASLDTTPGVEVSVVTSNIPLAGTEDFPYEVEGEPQSDSRRRPNIDAIVTTPDYFRVVGNPLLAGRDFNQADGTPSSMTAIVNRRAAETLWHGDAMGKRIRLYKKDVAQPWLTVVGVVPDITQDNQTRNKHQAIIYLPFRLEPSQYMSIAARTAVPPGMLKEVLRRKVEAIDDSLPAMGLRTMEEQLEQQNWPYRIFGTLFAIFAVIALGLASVGLYAVIAHSVSQRTQEIGVRMALGASSANVMRLVFSQGLTQLAIGLALGLTAALAVTRVLKTLLVNVSPSDPATFILVTLVLSAAAFLGCLIPARRAMRVDPIEALRHE